MKSFSRSFHKERNALEANKSNIYLDSIKALKYAYYSRDTKSIFLSVFIVEMMAVNALESEFLTVVSAKPQEICVVEKITT